MPDLMRADAARNRRAILAAAYELLQGDDAVGELTIAVVAARAGVGKATVIRAFGDRSSLLRALVDERAASWPAPLGSSSEPDADADPRRRVLRVMEDLVSFKLANRGLWLALELSGPGQGSPYRSHAYDGCHAALRESLHQVPQVPAPDFTAHMLLSSVRSDLLEHLQQQGASESDFQQWVAQVVDHVLRPCL